MKILLLISAFALAVCSSHAERVVCYYTNWGVYRPEPFKVENIDANLCTHIVYAFLGIDDNGNIKLTDPWNDIGDEWTEGAIKKFQKLRAQNPSVKLLIGVGGWNEGPIRFQAIVRNADKRKNFITSTLAFIRQYKFDGLEIAWIYHDPSAPADDKPGYAKLLQEMRPKFNENKFILSAATSGNKAIIDAAYDIPNMNKNLDFFNVMTYDFHGFWDKKTGHVAPLRASKNENEKMSNVEAVLRLYLKYGASADKLNVGLVSYGRTFTLLLASNHGLNSPSVGPGKIEPLPYSTFCVQDKKNIWTKYFDQEQSIPYAVAGDQWVGYENTNSLIAKVKFAKTLGIKGATFWSLDQDDFKGNCGDKFPLLKAVKQEISKR